MKYSKAELQSANATDKAFPSSKTTYEL